MTRTELKTWIQERRLLWRGTIGDYKAELRLTPAGRTFVVQYWEEGNGFAVWADTPNNNDETFALLNDAEQVAA